MMPINTAALRRGIADFLYLSTTDYIQHRFAPSAKGALGFYAAIDSEIGLLLELGAVFVVYAAGVGLLAFRPRPATLPVRVVVEANLAWAVLSCVALAVWLSPSAAGTVWTVLQAVIVVGFATIQHLSLKARQSINE